MYEAFYGLKEKPFRISPDPRFLFLTPQHQEVLSKCQYMIRGRVGPVYVFGPIGSGKTTIARRLHQQLAEDKDFRVASLIAPDLKTPNAFLRAIAREFGVKTERSFDETLSNFAAFLREQHERNVVPVLLVDEAQYLRRPLLRLAHFLLNYETTTEKLLQVVLFGQNELASHIDALPELKSRMFPSALAALNADETREVISFRMTVAGARQNPFSDDAARAVYRSSLGLPRQVCQLCDMALLTAFAAQEATIREQHVAKAAADLRVEKEVPAHAG
jgi:general secretion pathway protein A